MNLLKFMQTWMRRFAFRGLSIQQRLPFLICILLLCIIITFSCISYIGVRDVALATGKERLTSLTDQLSTMLATSSQTLLTTTRTAASDESIKRGLRSNDPQSNIETLAALHKLRPDSTWVLAELLNVNGRPVLRSAHDSLLARVNFDSLLSSFTLADFSGIGKIYGINNAMYYPVIMPVYDSNVMLGRLVRWRKVSSNPRSLQTLSQLIGTRAKLYIGNKDGTLWTDMIKPIAYQNMDTGHLKQQVLQYRDKDHRKVLAAARPIANTSWLVAVEFSEQSMLETANRFLRWIIIIGSVLLVTGIFVAWLMSRRITSPLKKLTAAATAIAGGNYAAAVAIERHDEIGKLSRAFNAMISQLSKARLGLEQKVIETIEVNEQLRNLSAYLQNVREDERIHIAREMHDELGQLLTGFKMDVAWLRKKIPDATEPVINEKLENMLAVIDEAVKFVRKLAAELRPSILDDLGLVPALEWHSQEFEKRYNIRIELLSDVQELHTSSLIATGLFRMYQESLTNVARHSNATKVVVNLRLVNDEIRLTIMDNGKGFDTSVANKKTLGLLGMKERAAMLGGTLEIRSEPGRGTSVLITVKQPRTEKVVLM